MSSTLLSPDLVNALRRLRLGQIVATLPDRIALAEKQGTPFQDLLLSVLTDEVQRRNSSAAERRAEEAGLDPDMTFERFDASAKISYDKRLLNELCSLRFLHTHRHVTLLGPVGVGKTFIANALGHLACQQGHRVLFTRADAMLQTLRRSRFDNSRDNEMHRLTTIDLLIVDDFALELMTRDESKDVYQLFVERTGHGSMILTSNRDTSEWLAMFDDALRAQSAVDRFANAAFDLVIEGESYRCRQKPTLEEDSGTSKAPAKSRSRSTRRRRR